MSINFGTFQSPSSAKQHREIKLKFCGESEHMYMTVFFLILCLNFHTVPTNLVPGYFGHIEQVDWNQSRNRASNENIYFQVTFSSQLKTAVWVITRGYLGSGLQQQLQNSSTYG